MEMEPTTSAAYGISKVWYAVGGIFGSGVVGAFWQPAALSEYGKYTKGVIIGGIGAGFPVMMGAFIASYLGLDPHSADVGMFIGTCVGLLSLGMVGFLTQYFKKREGQDILQVVQEARGAVAQPKKPAARKTPAKKKVAK